MMKYLLLILLTVFALVIASCKEDDPVEPPTPSMTILEAPNALLANVDSCYLYRVRVTNEPDLGHLLVVILGPDSSINADFVLWDDGSTRQVTGPDFACDPTGDIVPGDGIFTGRLNAHVLANGVTGPWTFRFLAGNLREVRTVQILNTEPCLITSYPLTQVFGTCSTMTADMHVTKTEGDRVDTAWVMVGHAGNPNELDTLELAPIEGDSVWQVIITPTFFECLNGSDYDLIYRAKTRFGMTCEQMVSNVSYVNSLPILSNSTLPDTIFHPAAVGDSDSVAFTVNMQDCELAGEIFYYGLFYNLRRHDRTEWDVASYGLHDDGLAPDITPGDGVFSAGLTIPWNIPDSLYYFRYYAIECAPPGDTSEFLIDSVQIWPAPGALSEGPDGIARGEATFGSW